MTVLDSSGIPCLISLIHSSPKEVHIKNLGRLWLAYTELQGDFYMLQLMLLLRPFDKTKMNQGRGR